MVAEEHKIQMRVSFDESVAVSWGFHRSYTFLDNNRIEGLFLLHFAATEFATSSFGRFFWCSPASSIVFQIIKMIPSADFSLEVQDFQKAATTVAPTTFFGTGKARLSTG
ncbi:hypothetical protein L1887_35668 [Cichorium endivia]|nr:hypothetical protein L1887_35668 [Cichorium endivia]